MNNFLTSKRVRRVLWGALVAMLMMSLGAWSFWPNTVVITLHPFVGTQPLTLNEKVYQNPVGVGEFSVRDFQFFMSNIRFVSNDATQTVMDSYHLVRFDDAAPMALVFDTSSLLGVHTLEFGIGVDSAANSSLKSRGDLDPNGRMAWSWEVGYKFVLLEGGFEHQGQAHPLVYHVGFSENYKTIRVPLNRPWYQMFSTKVDLLVDVQALFDAVHSVNMADVNTIKFDRQDARRMADNYAHLVIPCDNRCVQGLR